MRRAVLLLAVALPAFAQEQEIQRAVIERDQRTAEFAARVRDAPRIARQRLESLAARQLLEVRQDLALELRPYERQAAASEMDGFALRLPPPVVRVRPAEAPRPLPVKMPCAVDVVPADGIEPPTNGLQNRCSTS
jgi:hypothetical protein